MSKVQVAILDAISPDEWMSLADIKNLTGYKKSSVNMGVLRLFSNGLLLKKYDPDSKSGETLYKKSQRQCGFGVSYNISQFDQLLREVRV